MGDPVADALWTKVLETWDDDAVHQRFLSHCQAEGLLATAAERYRALVSAEGPEHDDEKAAQARKRLASVVILAMASIDAQGATREQSPGRAKTFVNCAALVVFIGLLSAVAAVLSR